MPSCSAETFNGRNLSNRALTRWLDGVLSGNCSARQEVRSSFLIHVYTESSFLFSIFSAKLLIDSGVTINIEEADGQRDC